MLLEIAGQTPRQQIDAIQPGQILPGDGPDLTRQPQPKIRARKHKVPQSAIETDLPVKEEKNEEERSETLQE